MKSYQQCTLSSLQTFKSFVGTIIFIMAILAVPSVNAKQVTICNVSPLNIDLAVRLGASPEQPTIGWFNQKPGDCRTWNVNENAFFYYAQSHEELAYWINDGKPQKWKSLFGFSMCVEPSLAFEMPAKGACQTKYNFKRFLLKNEKNKINLYATNQKHLELDGLQDARRQLTGVMDYEEMLRNSSGNEPPFQLGIGMEDSFESSSSNACNADEILLGGCSMNSTPKLNPSRKENGVRITRIFPGMPAETEGLETNDRIVLLNNYRINNKRELIWVLENVSLFNNEPLTVAIIRDGQRIDGTIVPNFFPFKHWEYSPDGKAGAFLWSTYDTAAFGFGNEVTCAAPQVLIGGLAIIGDGFNALNRVLGNENASSKEQLFDGKKISETYSACSKSLNLEFAKNAILYNDAHNAGFWAGLLIPGLPTARYLKAKGALPLAARSRKVAQKPGTKAFQGRH